MKKTITFETAKENQKAITKELEKFEKKVKGTIEEHVKKQSSTGVLPRTVRPSSREREAVRSSIGDATAP